MTTMNITRGTYADGSFGLRGRRRGGHMTIWFCGEWLIDGQPGQEPGYMGSQSKPCVHSTRARARACARGRRH